MEDLNLVFLWYKIDFNWALSLVLIVAICFIIISTYKR